MESVKQIFKEKFNMNIDELPEKAKLGLIDVEKNHNRSWTRDLYEKNKNNLDKVALFYRGTKVTYQELFDTVLKYTAVFEKMGINQDSEVPMCMSCCPEFLYTIMALNLLGAKMNCFGAFNPDYLTEIMNDCNSEFVMCTDDQYEKIKDSIDRTDKKKIVLFSLTDSLKDGKDPYIEIDREFYDFENKVPTFKEFDERIISKDEFLSVVEEENLKSITDYNIGDINTEFLVTYSSGSTNANRPKAIIHTNRSLLTIGRFQDPDLSGLPEMTDLIGEAIIPTHSNTSIISSMSDVLYKGCTIALEPIYNRDFLLYSLAINKPSYISVPRNMLVHACKKLYNDPRFKNFKMPYMMMLTAVGEPLSKGEEKFINKMLRKAKCGVERLPRPFSPVPVSIGGGDCERGGMFFTSYRLYRDLNPKFALAGLRYGLKKYAMVQLSVLDKNNRHLPAGSIGRLVVKTPTMMKGYKNNDRANQEFFIKDSRGDTWTDCNVYASVDKYGTVEILERIGKELVLDEFSILGDMSKIPLFLIGKEVERDTKHILSYEVVNIDNEIVIHIELQPGVTHDIPKILAGIETRILEKYHFGPEIVDKLSYRIRSFAEGFDSNSCGKRDYNALVREGITEKCVKLNYTDYGIGLINVRELPRNHKKKMKNKV